MKSRADLFALFAQLGIVPCTVEHPAVSHVGEGASVMKALPGAVAKNLFLRDAKGRLWLVSSRHDAAIDLKALCKMIGAAGRLSFASPALMQSALGVAPGSVTAFALINDPTHEVGFVLDADLACASAISLHPLENTATTTISPTDFRRFLVALGVEPLIVDLRAAVIDEPLTKAWSLGHSSP
jgi:Ala-tRNA(Pro) deacylase